MTKAKEILCDKKKRKQYDSWRRSGLDISFDLWLKTDQTNHVSMHWAPIPKKKKMIESCEAYVGKIKRKKCFGLQAESIVNFGNVYTIACAV